MNGLLIGELAGRTGVKAQTIRYYERLGVLMPARRTEAGYRRYGPDAAAELAFIKNAQGLGFSLDDIKRILDLSRAGHAPCSTVLALAKEHLSELDRRLEQLQSLRQHLTVALRRWESGGAPPDCASTLCGLISDAADVTPPTAIKADHHNGRPPTSLELKRRRISSGAS